MVPLYYNKVLVIGDHCILIYVWERGEENFDDRDETVTDEEFLRARSVWHGKPSKLRRMLKFHQDTQAKWGGLPPTRLQLGLPRETPFRPRPRPRRVRLATVFDQLGREGCQEEVKWERAGEERVSAGRKGEVGGGGEGRGGTPGEPSGQAANVGSNQKFLSVLPTSAQPAEEPGEQHQPPCQPSPPTFTRPLEDHWSPPYQPPAYIHPPAASSTSPWAWGSVLAGLGGPGLVWDAQCVGCGSWGRVIPIVLAH